MPSERLLLMFVSAGTMAVTHPLISCVGAGSSWQVLGAYFCKVLDTSSTVVGCMTDSACVRDECKIALCKPHAHTHIGLTRMWYTDRYSEHDCKEHGHTYCPLWVFQRSSWSQDRGCVTWCELVIWHAVLGRLNWLAAESSGTSRWKCMLPVRMSFPDDNIMLLNKSSNSSDSRQAFSVPMDSTQWRASLVPESIIKQKSMHSIDVYCFCLSVYYCYTSTMGGTWYMVYEIPRLAWKRNWEKTLI